LWLKDFKGQRVLIPVQIDSISLIGDRKRSLQDITEETVRIVCDIAEGQPGGGKTPLNAWSVLAYILASLFGLFLLFVGLSGLLTLLD
jgi:hypothetical protein